MAILYFGTQPPHDADLKQRAAKYAAERETYFKNLSYKNYANQNPAPSMTTASPSTSSPTVPPPPDFTLDFNKLG